MEYGDLKEEEYLVLVLVYDYAMRNFQRRTAPPQERSLPDKEKYLEYLPNNRLVMHPAGTELFKVCIRGSYCFVDSITILPGIDIEDLRYQNKR